MSTQYRDRLAKVLGKLDKWNLAEAGMLAFFIRQAGRDGEDGQVKLGESLDRIKELAQWTKAFIDQE